MSEYFRIFFYFYFHHEFIIFLFQRGAGKGGGGGQSPLPSGYAPNKLLMGSHLGNHYLTRKSNLVHSSGVRAHGIHT